jgi:hypothetical protein
MIEICNFCVDECQCVDGLKSMGCGYECWVNCDHYKPDKNTDCPLDKIAKLEKQLAELREKLRWIPVSDGYPKKDGDYEVKIMDWVEIGFWDDSKLSKSAWIEHGVTHYREIPELGDGE